MKTLGRTMKRRAFGFVFITTLVVWLFGSAGMYAFERHEAGGLESFPYAMWWTAMLLTSIGSEYWPKTGAGRALCFILGMYGFTVLGYFTATLASYFLGRDAESKNSEIPSANQLKALQKELTALRKELQLTLTEKNARDNRKD
jgi:voltage-gated potassium channel